MHKEAKVLLLLPLTSQTSPSGDLECLLPSPDMKATSAVQVKLEDLLML